MLLHIPHSNTTIPSYENKMAKNENVLESIEKYTDHRTSELFHYDGADRVEYNYSRVFCDVEKLEENEPMEALGLGILYDVSNKSRKHPNKALESYKEHHKKLLDTTLRQKNMFGKMVIIDCHSFSNEQAEEQGFSSDIPDICLGTDEIHTSSELLTLCKEHFEKDGYNIGINIPFSGTIIPLELYGDETVLSIMIEVNKAVYADEEGFDRLKRSIGVLLKEIDFFYG